MTLNARAKLTLLAAVWLLVSFLVLLGLYPWFAPAYQEVIVAAVNPVVESGAPFSLRICPAEADGSRIVSIRRRGERHAAPEQMTEADPHFIMAGRVLMELVALPALLLATPGRWPTRLRLLGIGLLGLFAFHVLATIAFVRSTLCVAPFPERDLCRWTVEICGGPTGALACTVTLWGSLALPYWVAASRGFNVHPTPSRGAPCPCGSGRKFKRCCGVI